MFDSNAILKAHYECAYDFARIRFYGRLVDAEKATQYLGDPLPGETLEFDPFHVASLFHAARARGEAEFLGKALSMLESLYALPNWRYPHHQGMNQVDLGMATTSARLAHVYEEIPGLGLEDVRTRLAEQVIARGLAPFHAQVTDPDRPGWARVYYNWRAYICADMGRAAMRLAREYSRWRDCIAEAIKSCLAVADAGDCDGGWEEGVGYWGMAFGQIANFAEELLAASGGQVNLFVHPYFAVAGDFGLYCSMPGNQAVYGFSDPCGSGPPRRDLMQSLARHFGNPYWQWCADQSDEPLACLYGPAPAAKRPDGISPSKHFRGLGVAVLRTGWSGEDVVAALKCGPRRIQAHQHWDANSFTMYNGRYPVLDEFPDCNCEEAARFYTQLGISPELSAADAVLGAKSTVAHNTVLFGGAGQLQGENEWGEKLPTYRTRFGLLTHGEVFPHACGARVVGFGQSEDLRFAVGEAAESYGPAVRSFRRSLIVGPSRTVLVVDRINVRQGAPVCSLFHAVGSVEQVSERAFLIRHGESATLMQHGAICGDCLNPRLRVLKWPVGPGPSHDVVAVDLPAPAGYIWMVYDFALDGRRRQSVQAVAVEEHCLVLEVPHWPAPVEVRVGPWVQIGWKA